MLSPNSSSSLLIRDLILFYRAGLQSGMSFFLALLDLLNDSSPESFVQMMQVLGKKSSERHIHIQTPEPTYVKKAHTAPSVMVGCKTR